MVTDGLNARDWLPQVAPTVPSSNHPHATVPGRRSTRADSADLRRASRSARGETGEISPGGVISRWR